MRYHGREDFIERARARLFPSGAELLDASRSDFDRDPEGLTILPSEARPAAVLIGLLDRGDDFHVLLTTRPETMVQHAGQVAFPGGRVDPGDTSPLAAALREANEEVGVRSDQTEILGQCAPYLTRTHYRVHPFVGLLASDFVAKPHEREVADVFETPLSFLMTPENHQVHSRVYLGKSREYLAIPHDGRYIWGATAGMIKALYDLLYND